MVDRRSGRIPWFWLGVAWLAAASGGMQAAESPVLRAPTPPSPVSRALTKGSYPWYDSRADSVKPIWPPKEWDLDWLDRWFGNRKAGSIPQVGNLVAYLMAMIALTLLLFLLVRLWRVYQPGALTLPGAARAPGGAARIEALPHGLRPETDDPWSEAVSCRARGDYARATVCLFAHQLLTLERLGQVRIIPGRTGRQLIRAIRDPQIRAWVDPSLRLFEAVYYGHHTPTPLVFEPVWAAAEAFERSLAEGASS